MADTDTATPPPSTPVQPEASPDLTATLPFQSMPESTDVSTPSPQPIQPQNGPALTSTIPSETAPNNPDIERQYHESWLHRKLDQVGTILGGGESITYTKDPDGNVSISHTPSTTKEKWGRIAQAALVGAASGLQNSQGPGGLAKAAAAGTQTGAQLPQQRTQQTQQSVDFDNKQLLARANRIHLTQQSAMVAAQTRLANLKVDQETANVLNANANEYAGRPGAIDYGSYDPADPQGESKIANQNPGAMDDFLGHNNRKTAIVLEADHKFHVYGVPTTDDERWNDKPVEVPYNDMDKDGNPIIATKPAQPGTVRMGQLDLTRDAVQGEYLKRVGIKAKADQDEAAANKPPAQPKDYQEAYSAASTASTPAEKQRLTTLGDVLYRKAMGLKTVTQVNVGTPTAPGATVADMIKPGGGFEPTTVNGVTAQKLATGDLTVDELPKRLAKGSATPQQTIAAADQYSQQLYGLPFSATQVGAEKKQFDNIKEQGILDGIDKMAGVHGAPGYLDTVVDLANKAGVGANAPWNTIALAVKTKLGDQAAKNFNTALGEVQRSLPSLIGNPLLGGSDSDLKQQMAVHMFGSDVTAGNLISTAGNLRGMLQGTRDSLTRNNRFLQRRYGLQGQYAAQFGGGQNPQQQNPQPQNNPNPNPQQLPAAIPNSGEIRLNSKTGQYMQLQGKQWVEVAGPTTR